MRHIIDTVNIIKVFSLHKQYGFMAVNLSKDIYIVRGQFAQINVIFRFGLLYPFPLNVIANIRVHTKTPHTITLDEDLMIPMYFFFIYLCSLLHVLIVFGIYMVYYYVES